jgi:hypothetical protein
MGGGLMQLVAYGAQDVYLSGNPQITFFKVVYRRHTNFAVEPIQQTWNGAADFGRTVTCNINRNGDLITNMYLAVNLAATKASNVAWGYVRRLGHALIQETKIEIGGSKIDEQYGDWLNVWYELTHKVGQERGYAKMIGDDAALTTISTAAKSAYMMYVPLQYWFNRNNGLALPLIALQYHDVRVTLIYNSIANCVNYQGTSAPSLSGLMADSYLLIDYVYLDSEERKRFAQASHEYLIEQLQFTGSETLNAQSNKYRLNFNHPCKYLIWVPHLSQYATLNQYVAYPTDGNWASAKALFCKLVWLASVLDSTSTSAPYQVSIPNGVADASGYQMGELFDLHAEATKAANWAAQTASNSSLYAVANKINAKIVSNVVGGLQVASVNDVILGDVSSVTMADLSTTVANLVKLLPGAPYAAVCAGFLSAAGVSMVNQFNYGNYLDGTDNPVCNGKLQLNGHDRFQNRDGFYFNYVQPYQHFENTPADGVNVYSFALRAQDHQPTGTCNFSRIDNATLQVDVGLGNQASSGYASQYNLGNSSSVLNIYTQNYNVLRVMSGMAGTAYSN